MARNYDETYLDGLIAKAKKSWEGVDVERYMSDLRDDSFDKEVAENLSKEVASYITEQMKSNMKTYGYPDTDCYVKVNPKKNMINVNGRNANSNLYSHSFVHELQRALRCCGLWNLANNFKI